MNNEELFSGDKEEWNLCDLSWSYAKKVQT